MYLPKSWSDVYLQRKKKCSVEILAQIPSKFYNYKEMTRSIKGTKKTIYLKIRLELSLNKLNMQSGLVANCCVCMCVCGGGHSKLQR